MDLNELKSIIEKKISPSKNDSIVKSLMDSYKGESTKLLFDEKVASNLDKAKKGDRKAKAFILDEITKHLSEILEPRKLKPDEFIENYWINYFGSYKQLYDAGNKEVTIIVTALKRLFIKRTSSEYDKKRKLAQIVYQECFGFMIADDLLTLDVNEVAATSNDCFWLEVSGVKRRLTFKMPQLQYETLIKVRVCYNMDDKLSTQKQSVEGNLLDESRVSCAGPPYNVNYSFNIRKHSDKVIDRQTRVGNGSTTEEFEEWCDKNAPTAPNIIICGGQSVGKTEMLRAWYQRMPEGTVLGTLEKVRELNFVKLLPQLITYELQSTKYKSYEEAIEDMLRYGLNMLVMGETRSPVEGLITMLAMSRTGRGSGSTFHTRGARHCIYDFASLLERTGQFSYDQAIKEYMRTVDLVMFLDADNMGDNPSGLRFVSNVIRINKIWSDDGSVNTSISDVFIRKNGNLIKVGD